jgi:hypothetical protein
MIDERQSLVAAKQIAGVLDLLDTFFHDVVGDPLLEVARLRRNFLLAFPQLKDEADIVQEYDAIG